MQRFYEGTVKPEQIDNLGHMNVRFYGVIAASAADALVAALGLESDALGELNARLLTSEAYTRFHREQLEGARLAVRGGVLAAEKTALDIYLELFNDESGEVSATYRQKRRSWSPRQRSRSWSYPRTAGRAACHGVPHGQT